MLCNYQYARCIDLILKAKQNKYTYDLWVTNAAKCFLNEDWFSFGAQWIQQRVTVISLSFGSALAGGIHQSECRCLHLSYSLPELYSRGGKAACFYGWGRKQLVWGCSASHPNVDVWKRFCEFWPKTTHLSPLTINGARVTSWDGDESSSRWVKKSASAVYTNCSLLELWYNPTSLRLFSSPSACTKCLLVTLQST